MKIIPSLLWVIAVAVLIVVFAMCPLSAPIDPDFDLRAFIGLLGAVFVLVVLIERATEIPIELWRAQERRAHAAAVVAAREKVANLSARTASATRESAEREKSEKEKAFQDYTQKTKRYAYLIGFSIAVVLCGAGVGLLDSILLHGTSNRELLRALDIILTAGLLAGGSDVFHNFVRALEEFLAESRKMIKSDSN